VEVLYLDRSQGDEVTPHQFVPDAEGWPTVRLLYRPGHYDMIYKSTLPYQIHLQQQPMPAIPMQSPYENSYEASYNETMTTLFPNSTRSSASGSDVWSQIAPSSFDFSRQSTHNDPHYQPPHATYPMPPFSPAHNFRTPMLVQQQTEPLPPPPTPSSAFPSSPGSFTSQPDQQQQGSIRMSVFVNKYEQAHHQPAPMETGPFKNSQYNPAHFHNSDFQPMLWNAENEYGRS